MSIVKATYVSVWEIGGRVGTPCDYNPETREVEDVQSISVDGMELEGLVEEFIELHDGSEIRDFTYEDIIYVNGQTLQN